MESDVKVEGLENLDRVLTAKAKAMRAAHLAAVALETKSVQSDAVRVAPLGKTGDLKAGIQARVLGALGEVETTARHSAFVEFGTSRTPAQPYMGPAAASSKARFIGRVAAATRRAVG